jgi:hypothetical protein
MQDMAGSQSSDEWQYRKRDNFYNQLMLDIETLGTSPGSAIVSVGAIVFGTDGLGDDFYMEIDRESCTEVGLEVDQDTLDWWESQGSEAREVLEGGEPLKDVLQSFNEWYEANQVYEVWAKSPAFDCVMMQEAYDALDADIEEPWDYNQTRDMRTIQELPMAQWRKQKGTNHHALDDARYQAQLVKRTLDGVVKASEIAHVSRW